VEVRDRVLAEAAAKAPGGHSLALAQTATAATSDVNRQFAIQQAEAAMQAGAAIPYTNAAGVTPEAHEALMRLNRHQAYYQRNAPKLCSFSRAASATAERVPLPPQCRQTRTIRSRSRNYHNRSARHERPRRCQAARARGGALRAVHESMPENDHPRGLHGLGGRRHRRGRAGGAAAVRAGAGVRRGGALCARAGAPCMPVAPAALRSSRTARSEGAPRAEAGVRLRGAGDARTGRRCAACAARAAA